MVDRLHYPQLQPRFHRHQRYSSSDYTSNSNNNITNHSVNVSNNNLQQQSALAQHERNYFPRNMRRSYGHVVHQQEEQGNHTNVQGALVPYQRSVVNILGLPATTAIPRETRRAFDLYRALGLPLDEFVHCEAVARLAVRATAPIDAIVDCPAVVHRGTMCMSFARCVVRRCHLTLLFCHYPLDIYVPIANDTDVDLKRTMVALLELTEEIVHAQRLVICLSRRGASNLAHIVRALMYVGFRTMQAPGCKNPKQSAAVVDGEGDCAASSSTANLDLLCLQYDVDL